MASPPAASTLRPTPPLLAVEGVSKQFSGVDGARRRLARRRARRDPGPARRERRRQVHAPEDPLGRAAARRSGTHRLRRRRLSASRARTRPSALRHRHHLPGAQPHPDAVGGREHLHRPRAAGTLRPRSTGAACAPRPRAHHRPRRPRPSIPTTPVSALSVAEQQLVEIARALSLESRAHHHGRADLGADRDPRCDRLLGDHGQAARARASRSCS